MVKIVNFEIVFSEIPDETTLALNISNCTNNCKGCHSPYLRENIGKELNEKYIDEILTKYIKKCTCVLFLGEGNDKEALVQIAQYIKDKFLVKIALYSGRINIEDDLYELFNYIKIGPYIEKLGSLKEKTTNQRLFHIKDGIPDDITYKFWK